MNSKIKRLPPEIQQKMKSYTSFQQDVRLACFQIPKGEVKTYSWLARKIGRPGAARAVGSALKANPFAPFVPCHRVIRSDGSLGGYSAPGGLRAKSNLLKREKAS